MGKPTADLARKEMEQSQAVEQPNKLGRFSSHIPEGANEETHKRWAKGHQYMDPAGVNKPAGDPVNHPPHYTAHPSGVECIDITEHMNFCLGNAMKYLWRAEAKGDAIENLEKARWYLDREIAKRKRALT